MELPKLLVQVTAGLVEQPPLVVAHSLMSVQVMPLPVKPAGQAPHVELPAVLVQMTGGMLEQPPLLAAHSLTSVQVMPSPV